MNPGEIAALTAAVLWTFSSMLWGQVKIPAFTLNACKNVIGCVFIVLHILCVWLIFGTFEFTTNPFDWGWLTLSGLVGIVAGDTLYFRCLQILGPRRALLIACASPLFATMLGYQFLEQQIGLVVLSGILLTVLGVATVVSDRRANVEAPGLLPGNFEVGVALGLLGAVCQAVGGLFSTLGMKGDCGALEATMIRLLIAAIASVVMLMAQWKTRKSFASTFRFEYLKFIVPATAIGTWLGIWLSQIAYKYADLAVAQTLISTCPLFAIPVVWILFGHKATRLAIVGTIVALVGVAMTVQKKEDPTDPVQQQDFDQQSGKVMYSDETWSVSQTPLAERKNW
ncbi:DMT family transporter [Mariniblastus fucicola]|uniref:EamA-like transporter family protein n=1 Tax=Mariniblastus fucicola TaxID=980251 RepID=A0A5B9PBG5_9BACT|nr:DMT family transporter [Mariniblastus fucicola]QEG20471.1 EamA-like transporter family protein [Mariniblastus fucicola]